MTEFILPHFGRLNLTSLDDYYDVDIEFDGSEIQIDLNFENKGVDRDSMNIVKNFIENIDRFNKQNQIYINNDYKDDDGDTVRFYLQHHLEDFDKNELSHLIDFDNATVSPEKQLLSKLRLVRVGLYPDCKDNFAIFDYSIGIDLTQYLVVVNTDKEGNLNHMTMES